ncbi:MAG TPA: hypothetical protein PKA19_16480 [Bacillota bacterium]|nr:hypothetical protein [Bacillota bacterium]
MLVKELSFPTVYHEDAVVGYGGNQEWFSQNMQRRAGCGCTSGTNLAAYYAANHPEMAVIYDGNSRKFDQAEYIRAMEEMYTYMKPGMIGYPYVKKFGRQFVRFCREHGIEAEAKFCHGFHSEEEAIDFVRESIDGGDPVALLILFHRASALKEDNWHWVTITGYAIDENDPGHIEIILSNCGERQIINAHQLFEIHRKNTIRMVSFRIL